MKSPRPLCLLLAATALLAAQASAHAELIYGLSNAGNNIFTFDSATPGKLLSGKFISGLQSGEELLNIDVRPSNNLVYSVSSQGRLYTVNPLNGVATLITTGTPLSLDGVTIASDFAPTNSNLRVGSDTGMNLRVDPTNGALISADPNFFYTPASTATIVSLAYSNNIPNAPSTTLYGLDSGTNNLVIINPPNNGTLSVVGGLGLDFTELAGFDISNDGLAFASLQSTSSSISNLYTINLATGVATSVGQIGGGLAVRDIALVGGGGVSGPTVPEPASLGVLALGSAAFLLRRRKA